MRGRRRDIFSRIYARVVKVYGPLASPCWLWLGSDSGNGRGGGYGRIRIDGCTMAVHRAMFMLWHGPIAPKRHIDHKCKNRACCNPLHLESVTCKQNHKRRDGKCD